MKNILPTLIRICLVLFAVNLACKKANTVFIQQPTACFTPQVFDMFSNYLQNGPATFIDSNFYFRNCSDSAKGFTYRWNFGDGNTSTDRNPVHHYGRRGKYTVTLEVANKNLAFDTARQTVAVVLGQQLIGFGPGNHAIPVAMEESASGDFLLLGSTNYNSGYFLMQLDSLLKQKNRKDLPASYRFGSMKPTSDGHYIFTGTTTGFTRENELIKLSASGSFLWNRKSNSDDNYINVYPAPDGGFVVLAAQPEKDSYGNTTYYTKLKKFDGNGSMQWQRSLYAEGMMQSKEAVVEPDGVIVAGSKRGTACSECDSVLIMKLDNAGNPVWKNTVFAGLNSSLGSMCIIKHTNGNYITGVKGTRGIFIFSTTGAFLDRKLATNQITALANSGDGHLIVLHSAVSKMRLDGSQLWQTAFDGRQRIPNGYRCCSDSWPVTVLTLRNGGTLAVAYRADHYENYSSSYYVMTFLPLDEDGKLK